MPDTLEIRKVASCKIYFYQELKAYCNINKHCINESNKSVGRDTSQLAEIVLLSNLATALASF